MEFDSKSKKSVNNLEMPNGWKKKNLRSLAKFFSGGTPLTTKQEFYNGDIPFIKSGEIYDDKTAQFISEEGLNSSSAKMIEKGDLLFALYGANSGEVAISKMSGAINQAILCIKHNVHCDTIFLYNYLLIQKERIIRTYLQGGQGNLSAEIVKSLSILLPPVPEQKAIAKVLGSMDEAINANNQLIAQKELRKKWLMQNLLTGKKRLKGFIGEWKEVKLGKVFEEIKSVNDGGDSHSVMTISSKLGLISQKDKFDRVIAGESLKKYTQLRRNDFAYNKGNSKTYPMGCIYQLEEQESALVPFVYICFRPTEAVDAQFYKHWFLAYGLDRQLKRIITSGARGDGLLNVNKGDFFKLKTVYPNKDEQTAIAQILQAADKELNLLKAKTELLKEQKKGMMQVLLTGKKRLNLNIDSL